MPPREHRAHRGAGRGFIRGGSMATCSISTSCYLCWPLVRRRSLGRKSTINLLSCLEESSEEVPWPRVLFQPLATSAGSWWDVGRWGEIPSPVCDKNSTRISRKHCSDTVRHRSRRSRMWGGCIYPRVYIYIYIYIYIWTGTYVNAYVSICIYIYMYIYIQLYVFC